MKQCDQICRNRTTLVYFNAMSLAIFDGLFSI